MRSKCRCSCVLQFTLRRAVSCVLHRPSSQVIHCIEFCILDSETKSLEIISKALYGCTRHKPVCEHQNSGRASLKNTLSSSTPHPNPKPPAARKHLYSNSRQLAVSDSKQTSNRTQGPGVKMPRGPKPLRLKATLRKL